MGSDSKFGVEGLNRTAAFGELSHESESASDRDRVRRDKWPLHLWLAHPEDFSTEEVVQKYAPLLTEDERTRWQRFRYPRHRREYLATRALVRSVLSHYCPFAPEEWRFQPNAHGKPAAVPDCGLRFNLSNSLGLVVCLIGTGTDVGVDVEPCERAQRIAELAPEVFSPLELAQLEALPNGERLNRALSLWTLKESYIKARGMGLSLELSKFSFVFGGADGIRLEVDACLCEEPGRTWRFCVLDHAGHRIALMADRQEVPELELWEFRPLPVSAQRLPETRNPWFPAT
jgi:4'-phosphopantetheinyl transferase